MENKEDLNTDPNEDLLNMISDLDNRMDWDDHGDSSIIEGPSDWRDMDPEMRIQFDDPLDISENEEEYHHSLVKELSNLLGTDLSSRILSDDENIYDLSNYELQQRIQSIQNNNSAENRLRAKKIMNQIMR